MAEWYDQAIKSPGNDAGSFVTGYAKKGVLHTTEGSSAIGAIGAYKKNNSWPHFTVDILSTVYQHIGLNLAARSLQNLSGGVETNRGGAIQIEVVGYASKPNWPITQVEAIRKLMRWIEAQTGIKPMGPTFGSSEQYGLKNPFELTGEQWKGFNGWCGHQHVPENCVTPETPILCADLVWRAAGDLEVGDELVGFDENVEQIGTCAGRRFRTSTVEHAGRASKECYKVTTTEGTTIATGDHPWLVRMPYVNHGQRVFWVETKNLDPVRHEIYWLGNPWATEDSQKAGYLSGLLDADGHYQSSPSAGSWVGFGQVVGNVLEEFCFEMESRGFITKRFPRGVRKSGGIAARQEFVDVRIKGGLWETARVLGTLRPPRLLRKINFDTVVGKTTKRIRVLSVEPVGVKEIVSLQTSSSTYVANGMLCHNSHWDPGAINLKTLLPTEIVTVKPMYEPALNLGEVVASLPRPGGVVLVNRQGDVFAFNCRDAGAPGRHPDYWNRATDRAAQLVALGDTGYYVAKEGADQAVGGAGWYAYP